MACHIFKSDLETVLGVCLLPGGELFDVKLSEQERQHSMEKRPSNSVTEECGFLSSRWRA